MLYIGGMEFMQARQAVSPRVIRSEGSGKVTVSHDASIVMSARELADYQIMAFYARKGTYPMMNIAELKAAQAPSEIGAGRGRGGSEVVFDGFDLAEGLADDQIRAFLQSNTVRIYRDGLQSGKPFHFIVESNSELKRPSGRVARQIVKDALELGWKVSVRTDSEGSEWVDVKVRRELTEEELAAL